MALKILNAEECAAAGLPDATQLNASNSNWDQGGPFIYYRTAGGYTNPGVYQCFPSAVAGDAYGSTNACGFATNGDYRLRMFFMVNSLPADSSNPGRILKIIRWQQPYNAVTIDLDNLGRLKLYTNGTASNTMTLVYTSTMTVPINTWVRLDLVIHTGTTTSNSIVGLAAVKAPNANRRYTEGGANSSTEAYYYSTNRNLGVSQGISNTRIGKAQDATLYFWQPSIPLDDIQIDNEAFGSNPNSWIGNIYETFTDLLSARATPALSIINTTNVNVKLGALTARATPALAVAGLTAGEQALTAAAVSALLIAGAASRSQVLDPFAAAARLVLNPDLQHQAPTLTAGAPAGMFVVPGAREAISFSANALMTLLGVPTPTALLRMLSTASMEVLGQVLAIVGDDAVVARILSQGGAARLFGDAAGAVLLKETAKAALFEMNGKGVILPAGTMAVIQD